MSLNKLAKTRIDHSAQVNDELGGMPFACDKDDPFIFDVSEVRFSLIKNLEA